MGEKALLAQIVAARHELARLASLKGLSDPSVMDKSREIDRIVVCYYRMVLHRKGLEKSRTATTS